MAHDQSLSLSSLSQPQRRTSLLARLFGAEALWRSRKDLEALTDAQLSDIGISARDAAAEARRMPWDVPTHWRG